MTKMQAYEDIYENLYSPYNGSIIHNRKKMLKNLSKQSDYDKKATNR